MHTPRDQCHDLPHPQEIEGEQQGVGPGVDAIQMRSEYQLYKDAEYKPQRWIGPVDVQSVPGVYVCVLTCCLHSHL